MPQVKPSSRSFRALTIELNTRLNLRSLSVENNPDRDLRSELQLLFNGRKDLKAFKLWVWCAIQNENQRKKKERKPKEREKQNQRKRKTKTKRKRKTKAKGKGKLILVSWIGWSSEPAAVKLTRSMLHFIFLCLGMFGLVSSAPLKLSEITYQKKEMEGYTSAFLPPPSKKKVIIINFDGY